MAEKKIRFLTALTTMAKELNDKVQSITLLNGFQTGPEMIQGYQNIVTMHSKARSDSDDRDKSLSESDQTKIGDALTSYLDMYQPLLETTTRKHDILEVTGVAYQAAAVLRGVEGEVDELAFSVINSSPKVASKVTEQQKKFDASIARTIDTYAGGLP